MTTEVSESEETKWFQCHNCNLQQQYDIKGKAVQGDKYLTCKEDSYIMVDPFTEPSKKNILILGSDCALCENSFCQSPDCSIFYKRRYCLKCALQNKTLFPPQLQMKIEKMKT